MTPRAQVRTPHDPHLTTHPHITDSEGQHRR